MKKIFGHPIEEIRKQTSKRNFPSAPTAPPINEKDTFLEPCLRGADKILNDPQKKELIARILRGN